MQGKETKRFQVQPQHIYKQTTVCRDQLTRSLSLLMPIAIHTQTHTSVAHGPEEPVGQGSFKKARVPLVIHAPLVCQITKPRPALLRALQCRLGCDANWHSHTSTWRKKTNLSLRYLPIHLMETLEGWRDRGQGLEERKELTGTSFQYQRVGHCQKGGGTGNRERQGNGE